MRLVKKTVNQDDIQTYHLFFADDPFLNNIPPLPEQTIRLNEQVGQTGSVWQGNFDIVLPISPPQP